MLAESIALGPTWLRRIFVEIWVVEVGSELMGYALGVARQVVSYVRVDSGALGKINDSLRQCIFKETCPLIFRAAGIFCYL